LAMSCVRNGARIMRCKMSIAVKDDTGYAA
jgi:hypothetical protein